MFIVFFALRDPEQTDSAGCATFELWVLFELLLYLIAYICTLSYAIRALLYPLFSRPITEHERIVWYYVGVQILSGLAGANVLRGEDCPNKSMTYTVWTGVVSFSICLIFSICIVPYWRQWLVTRRNKAIKGQEKERRYQDYLRESGRN